MKNTFWHHLLCIAPFVALMSCPTDAVNDVVWFALLLLWAAVYVPVLDYFRLKSLGVIDGERLKFRQKVRYAYAARCRYFRRMFFG